MTAYLVDHQPRIRQFRDRGTKPSGVVVVHTAESTPDWVGHDTGAEAVARFIQGRTDYGSYHDLCDSDSIVNLVPYDQQAYGDGTGSNPHAYHVSAATQAAKWNQAPEQWREATVRNMAKAAARYARWLKATHGVTIPARRVSRAQSTNRVPGFISHGERDPGRRSDPGASFPWRLFLDTYAAEMGGTTQEDDMQLNDKFKVGPKREIDVEAFYRYMHNETARQGAQLDRIVRAAVDVDALADAVVKRMPKSQQIDRATVKAGVLDALKEGTA